MQPRIEPVTDTQPVQHRDTPPAIVVPSSSLVVLHANRGGMAVLRELTESREGSTLVPPPVLAYLADGILKDIDLQPRLRVSAPFSMSCSIRGPARIWHCQAFELPAQDECDRSRIAFLFSEKCADDGETEQQTSVATSSSRPSLLGIHLPETIVIS